MTTIVNLTNTIDWDLFARQKQGLVAMCDDEDRLTEEIEILDGVVHLMDAVQDTFQPYDEDEDPNHES